MRDLSIANYLQMLKQEFPDKVVVLGSHSNVVHASGRRNKRMLGLIYLNGWSVDALFTSEIRDRTARWTTMSEEVQFLLKTDLWLRSENLTGGC